jgi:hypothetical protein
MHNGSGRLLAIFKSEDFGWEEDGEIFSEVHPEGGRPIYL